MKASVDAELFNDKRIKESISFLTKEAHDIRSNEWAVCHGDINHNNWLLTVDDQLFLIDWDGARIADPALDIGILLYLYIPRSNWMNWLAKYGMELTNHLRLRLKWYAIVHTIETVQWLKNKGKYMEMEDWLTYMQDVLH